jgi:leucyl-tRNA synthetase
MEFTNLVEAQKSITIDQWKRFLILLAPFAPYATEELWQEVNGYKGFTKENSVHSQSWPSFDETLLKQSSAVIGVQINGKLRAQIEVTMEESEQAVKDRVLSIPEVQKWVEGNEMKKFIYIPGKIVNIVI